MSYVNKAIIRTGYSHLRNFSDLAIRWCQKESSFIFWIVTLNLTYVAHNYLNNYIDLDFFQKLIRVFYRLPIIFFLALLLDIFIDGVFRTSFLNRIIKSAIILFSVCTFMVNLFVLYYYKCQIDEAMIKIILGTKPVEAGEFFDVYIANWHFLRFVLIVVLSIFIIRYVYMRLSGVKIFWAAMIPLSILAGIWGIIYRPTYIKSYLSVSRLPSLLLNIANERANYEQALKGARVNIALTKNESSIPYVVFILGESENRNHMSLYGYTLPTTPRLLSRSQYKGMYVFQDAISSDAYTIPSLEKLFTFCDANLNRKWFTYANLFGILRLAGYHVEWITNQETFGPLSYVSQFYAEQGGIRKFAMAFATGNTLTNYDEKILPVLDESLRMSGEKNFYVLHIMGSHGKYLMRYPKEFEKFSYKDEKDTSKKFSDEQKQVRAEYDNSVLYNDFIVDEIIRRFENKDAVVIYISDHGEDVYDEMDMAGHSFDTRHGCEIPMIIWTSPQFRAARSELCQRIERSVNRPFMTDDMIHVILDILDIETSDYDPRKSVINDMFDETRERIYYGKVYDRENGLRRK